MRNPTRISLMLLLVIACIAYTAAAQRGAETVGQIMAQAPECALSCVLQGIRRGNCSLASVDELAQCTCSNIPLQAELSTCVQLSCIFNSQVVAANLLQDLCFGFPVESTSHEVRIVAIVGMAVTFPIVALRFWARWVAARKWWWDEWTVLMASVMLAALASIIIAMADLGFGLHYWNVIPSEGETLIQLFYATQIVYIFIQVFAKISILLFFIRIFPVRWLRRTNQWFIGFMIVHGLLFLGLIIFQCLPVSSIWDRSDTNRKCLNVTAIGYAGAVFSIVEDLVILVLPIPELLKLQMSRRKKIAIGCLFSIGSFACVTTMIRLKYLVMFSSTLDTTWDNVEIVSWSIIEEFLAILCACLPALQPLVRKIPWFYKQLTNKIGSSAKGSTAKNSKPSLPTSSQSSAPSRRSVLTVGGGGRKFRQLRDPLVDDLMVTQLGDHDDDVEVNAIGARAQGFEQDGESSTTQGPRVRDSTGSSRHGKHQSQVSNREKKIMEDEGPLVLEEVELHNVRISGPWTKR